MAQAGFNTVRVYTVPEMGLLDTAARHGLRVMVGVPWTQHVAFLGDRPLTRGIREQMASTVRALGSHPAVLMFAVGNEIPPRWFAGTARPASNASSAISMTPGSRPRPTAS